jgi:predicted transcriptional regulator
MKKKLLLLTVLLAYILHASAQQSIVKDALEQFVAEKVESMQALIGLDDKQAYKLKELELNFLLDVNDAENCFWCRTKKRVEKLKVKKQEKLKEILSHDQFIKYDALENNKIKKHPIYMN